MNFSTTIAPKTHSVFDLISIAKDIFAAFHPSVTTFPHFIENTSADNTTCQKQDCTYHNYNLCFTITYIGHLAHCRVASTLRHQFSQDHTL